MKLKTSEEWQKECTVIVHNPDGWHNDNCDWHKDKISKEDFEKRLCFSTVQHTNLFLEKMEMLCRYGKIILKKRKYFSKYIKIKIV